MNFVQAFEAASRLRSFKAAAQELGLSPSTVTYRILSLENLLDAKLFIRGNRAIELTADGQNYASYCRAAIGEISTGIDQASMQTGGRPIKICIKLSISTMWLASRLPEFISAFPDIDLQLLNSDFTWSAPDGGFDLELFTGYPDNPSNDEFCVPLFDEYSTPVLHVSHFKECGGAADSKSLANSVLLHDTSENFIGLGSWPVWLEAAGYHRNNARSGIRFGTAAAAIGAAKNQCGTALGRATFVLDDISRGDLIAPYDLMIRLDRIFWLRCLHIKLLNPDIRKFRDWIMDQADRHQSLLEEFIAGRRISDSRQGDAVR